jgi:hypothetical protein
MKRTILVFVILAGFLSGCASTVHSWDKIHSVAKGKTTVAEASSLFGKPYLVVSHEEKWGGNLFYKTLYVWDHAEADLIDESGRKIPQKGFLMAIFDNDGILIHFRETGTTSDAMIDYWNAPGKQP